MFGILYADPGSGMLMWQLIAAAGLGLLFYARTILRRIRNLFVDSSKENETTSAKE